MKLARFAVDGTARLGRVDGDHIIDLSAATAGLNGSMRLLIERLPELRPALEQARELHQRALLRNRRPQGVRQGRLRG